MGVGNFLKYRDGCDTRKELEYTLAAQCAPVLKQVKASNLVAVPKDALLCVRKQLAGTGIKCKSMSFAGKRAVLLLYRRSLLRELLQEKKVRVFLAKLGYRRLTVHSVIGKIRRRYHKYLSSGQGIFPHELGVILEYPVEDVAGFMKNRGHGYLMSGYWKVYHDAARAWSVFCLYDQARRAAVKEVDHGHSIRQVAGPVGQYREFRKKRVKYPLPRRARRPEGINYGAPFGYPLPRRARRPEGVNYSAPFGCIIILWKKLIKTSQKNRWKKRRYEYERDLCRIC